MRIRYQAILLYVARAAGQFSLLAVAMILARMMSEAEYGTFGQIMMVAAMGASILHMGTSQGVGYFFPRLDRPGQRALLVQMIGYLSLAGLAVCTFAFFGAGFLSREWENPELAGALRYASIWAGLQILPTLTPMALIASKHPKLGSIAPILLTVISRATVPLAFYFTRSLERTFMIATIPAAVQFALSVYLMAGYPFRGVKLPVKWPSIMSTASKCIPLGVTALMGTIGMWLDKLFISSFYGPADFAIFRNGAFEVPFLTMLAASVFTVILPRMSELSGKGDHLASLSLWKRGAEVCALVFLPAAAFFVIFRLECMLFLFGPKYADSALVFGIYSVEVIIRIAMYGQLFVTIGRPGLASAVAAGTVVFNAVMNYVLIKLIGFTGPAIATVLAHSGQALVLMIIAARLYKTSFANIFPWGRLVRVALAAVVSAAAASPARMLDAPALVKLLAGFAICVAVFVIAARITGGITAEEYQSGRSKLAGLVGRFTGRSRDGGDDSNEIDDQETGR